MERAVTDLKTIMPNVGIKPSVAIPPVSAPKAGVLDLRGKVLTAKEKKGFTQQDVINDPNKISKIREYMVSRFGTEWKDASEEEVLDKFVSHMRWVNTNEVNTVGEARAVYGADDNTKAKYGEAYKVYEDMSTMFSNGPGEIAEGAWDYTSAVLTSPSTYLGGVLGRAVSKAGTKAAQKAITTATTEALAKEATKNGVSSTANLAARREVLTAAMKHNTTKVALTAALTDGVMATGQDALYQDIMMETGAQDKYSIMQTAAASITGLIGGGIAVIPERGRGRSGLSDVAGKITKARKERASRAAKNAAPEMKAMIERISTDWLEAAKRGETADAKGFLRERTLQTFLDVEDENSLVRILQRAGAEFNFNDNVTLSSQLIDFATGLSEEAKQSFDEALRPLNIRFGEMMDIFARVMQESGQNFSKASIAKRFLQEYQNISVSKRNAAQDLLNSVKDEAEEKSELTLGNTLGYAQAIWKKMVVSSIPTTVVNVKGWTFAMLGRSFAEVIHGTAVGGLGFAQNLVKPGSGINRLRESKALLHSQVFTARTMLDPFTSVEAFSELLSRAPKKIQKRSLETFFGGVREETAANYGINPNSFLARNIDKASEFAAQVSLVRTQDIYTKTFSGLKQLDIEVRNKFGVGLDDLVDRGEYYKIDDEMWGNTINAMLKDTFSQDYTKGGGILNKIANTVETMSNVPGIGFVLPFGRFLNNTVAFTLAYSPLGLFPLASKAYRKSASSMDIGEKMAKAVVGTTFLFAVAANEAKKQEEGLQWFENKAGDGQVENVSTLFPMSVYNLAGRIIHNIASNEGAPRDLMEELKKQVGPLDAITSVVDGGIVTDLIKYLAQADENPEDMSIFVDTIKAILPTMGGIAAGYTRPLDMPNDILGTILDAKGVVSDQAVDRKQADGVVEATLLNLSRYTNTLFNMMLGEETEDGLLYGKPAQSATEKDPVSDPNPMSTMFGRRLEPARTNIDRVLGMVDKPPFRVNSFTSGVPEYDAFINDVVFNTLERKATQLLKSDIFKKAPMAAKRDMVEKLIRASRDEVLDMVESPYVGDQNGRLLNERRKLMVYDQSLRAEAKKALSISTKDRELTLFQIQLIRDWIEVNRKERNTLIEGM